MAEKYDVYCEFDAEKHAETYVNYLEVLILEDGEVVYAVPSHTMRAEKIVCEKLGIEREKINALIPRGFYGDYGRWLCKVGNLVMVWTNDIMAWEVNKKQLATLRRLKLAGIYKGVLPDVG